ncbi:response regulator [Thalassotalea sp. PLHSN55]|uniref:response regulator n=1 Tax=Thalassotalea sp. PLHSN55 TaxID=3435888 RepID=UPI003F82A0BC
MKILVADDMISMRHVLIHILRSLDYTDIDEAIDGIQAFEMLQKKRYDVLITDFHMPKLDGHQLLERVRNHAKLARLPVLMISCEASKEKIQSIIASKVTGFIVKPFTAKTIEKQLNKIKQKSSRLTIQIE